MPITRLTTKNKILLLLLIAIVLISGGWLIKQFLLKGGEEELVLTTNLAPEAVKNLEEKKAKNFESLKLFPNNYDVYLDLGNIERELGNASLAIEYFRRAWEIIPTNSTPWLNIGNIYIELGKYQEAEAAFLKAKNVNPAYYFVYYNLAKLYQDFLKEKSDQVRAIYLDGLKNTNNDYQLLQPFTDYLIESGNYSEALQYLEVLKSKIPLENIGDVQQRIEEVRSLISGSTP